MNLTEKRKKAIKQIKIISESDDRGIPYKAFDNVPRILKLKDSHVGKRVWRACEPRTKKLTLLEIKEDSYVVKERGYPYHRNFYKNEIVLHPKEIK